MIPVFEYEGCRWVKKGEQMSQIGEPQRVIISEPAFEPIPIREEPIHEPVREQPQPDSIPVRD